MKHASFLLFGGLLLFFLHMQYSRAAQPVPAGYAGAGEIVPAAADVPQDFASPYAKTVSWPGTAAPEPPAEPEQTGERGLGGLVVRVTAWYRDHLNLGTVALLMTVESSFIPFPSEVVVPPAAYWACQAGSDLYLTDVPLLNVLFVVLAGSLGALLGAVFNYLVALWLGRPVIYKLVESRLGHLCLLSAEKMQRAEDYFCQYGKVSTLIGRMVPVVRQLISLPAGLARMRFGIFLIFTLLGATVWNALLALFGYLAHGQQELIEAYSHEISVTVVVLCGLGAAFLVVKWLLGRKS